MLDARAYCWSPLGYIFVDGHWDYPLGSRGLLFSPIYVAEPALVADWTYQPSYCVSNEFLQGSLFVRPSCNDYYFGDYFGPEYESQGYTSWVDFRMGGRFRDPLYSYACWENRDDPDWQRDLYGLYQTRRRHDFARPPRTLAKQTNIVQNIHNVQQNIQNINNTKVNVHNMVALTSVKQINETNTNLRLQQLPDSERTQIQQAGRKVRDFQRMRSEIETQVKAKAPERAETVTRKEPIRVQLPDAVRRPIREAGTSAPPRPRAIQPGAQVGQRPVDEARPATKSQVRPRATQDLRPGTPS